MCSDVSTENGARSAERVPAAAAAAVVAVAPGFLPNQSAVFHSILFLIFSFLLCSLLFLCIFFFFTFNLHLKVKSNICFDFYSVVLSIFRTGRKAELKRDGTE